MVTSKRIEPIQEIANNSANLLSRGVADAEHRLAESERRLEQLQSYRSEYGKSSERATGVVDAVRLQNLRLFVDRLSDAIRAQSSAVNAARLDYESKKEQWSEKRVEAESLGKVMQRFKQDERRAADRREQLDSDESAMRRWLMDSRDHD